MCFLRMYKATRKHCSRMRTARLPTVCVVVSGRGDCIHTWPPLVYPPLVYSPLPYPVVSTSSTLTSHPLCYTPSIPGPTQKGPGTRHAHDCGENDRYLWKHYLSATFACDHNFMNKDQLMLGEFNNTNIKRIDRSDWR